MTDAASSGATDSGAARRLRVLVIAEAANPEWVSVPLIGWSLAEALRGVVDVHLVTQIRNRDAILRAGWVEGRDFTAIDTEALAAPAWKLSQVLRMGESRGWTIVQAISSLTYPWFERKVWQQFGAALKRGDYDLVHRITPLSPAATGSLAAKCRKAGVPFVLGPLNGGVPWPKGFEAEQKQEGEWLSRFRGMLKLFPGRSAMLNACNAILYASRFTRRDIPETLADRCIYLPENAIDPARFFRQATPEPGTLKACFIGRFVPLKGLGMLIEAARPLVEAGRLELHLVGDGPLAPALKDQAKGLAGVQFHGWLKHEQVQDVAAGCHVLAFPSIREFGGGAVLEGMALGLAPLVVDYGGPADLVSPEVGIKVPLTTREETILALRLALEQMAADPEGTARMGQAARQRVTDLFTWPRRAEQILTIYDWVLGRRPTRPEPITLR
ncbi:MAG: glycosyltransferase family 4 protein [Tabrizicola sp.]|uniref:glycosyltransferase family 4 protein n=1 Tax=Tabrizicola sp. TaxID=2005166 RepID=UPI0027376F4B|nr:glycosyltransferase family 4 protein [Tabrizicola sp.]MDP3262086.1 glycosyltransferase family 4 protein [Tabrizicola sp.]